MATPVQYLELIYDPITDELYLDVSQARRPEIAASLRPHLTALGWVGRIDHGSDASCILFIDTSLVDVLNALSLAGWVRQPPMREPLQTDLQRTLFARVHTADGVDYDALRAAGV
jgi:hypothetical protein